MKPLIDIAKECGIHFGESDVSRDIISRLQLENIVLASIEQHQKDALDVVPCAWEVLLLDSDTAHLYYDKNDPGFVDDMTNNDDAVVTPLYPASTVSALQARIAELESVRAASTVFMDAVKIDRLDVEDWPTDSNNAYQCLKAAIDAIRALAVRGKPVGFVMVPSGPTREMLNAAIDVDSFKLGDISPLGFRCSPQQLFERCYRAMLAAAPKETP